MRSRQPEPDFVVENFMALGSGAMKFSESSLPDVGHFHVSLGVRGSCSGGHRRGFEGHVSFASPQAKTAKQKNSGQPCIITGGSLLYTKGATRTTSPF